MNVRFACALVALFTFAAGTIAPARADEPRDPYYWLTQINKASAVMLVERGIVPKPLGATMANAVIKVNAAGNKSGADRSRDYAVMDKALADAGGPDMTRIHPGADRQDIGATEVRLVMRDDLLGAFENLIEARAAIIAMAAAHPNAIVPAYASGVQTQPMSFGNYMLAYNAAFTRLAERMRQTYGRLNQSPLGSTAVNATVDRPRLAALLGFDGILDNALDANQISPIDDGAEIAAIAASGALTVGTFIADVSAQYGQTKPWLVLGSGTGTSRPVQLNYVRGEASAVIGHAQTYVFLAHNVQAGTTDYKPFVDPAGSDEPINVLNEAADLFTNYGALVKALVLNEPRALDEVNAGYAATAQTAANKGPGTQATDVTRLVAAANAKLESDRQWLATAQGKLDTAATKLDAAFAHLRT